MAGIESFGAYIPYYRLPLGVIGQMWGQHGGRGEKAVAGSDEDTVTMAVAAGLDCLKGIDPRTVNALFLATTCSPYRERQCANIVAHALDLPRDSRNADFGNCLRAGTTAMLLALDTVKAGSINRALVTSSDMRLSGAAGGDELAFGDGSAALLIGNNQVVAEIEAVHTYSDDLCDYWRDSDDKYVRHWEDRFGREEGYLKIPSESVKALLKKIGLAQGDITKLCLYGPNARVQATLGKKMGFKPEQIQNPLLDTVGDTGTALSLMILVAALEESNPGDRILLVSYGNGSDAILLRVTEEITNLQKRRGIREHLKIKKVLNSYGRYLRWREMVSLAPAARPEPVPASMPAQWREHQTALALYGVKCKKCGTPQMFLSPSSTRAHICLHCQAKDNFEPYRFADKLGTVRSFSHDYLAGGIDPPNTASVIDFDGGGRGQFLMVDREPDECQVGMRVEMTFRKLVHTRGAHTYFWKCKPVRD